MIVKLALSYFEDMSKPIEKITIRSLGSAGEGIGTAEEGYALFVTGALPGERVSVEIVEKKERYAKGRMIDLIDPSPERVTPFCPLFSKCGGCQIQHLSYSGQLEAKRQRVVDALQRIGRLEVEVLPCLPSPSPTHYRNKIQMPIHAREGGRLEVGFYERGSHRIVPIPNCPIHCHAGEVAYEQLRPLLLKSAIPGYCEEKGEGLLRHLVVKSSRLEKRALVILVTTGRNCPELRKLAETIVASCPAVAGVVENINRKRGNSILSDQFRQLAGEDHLWEELCGKRFRISPASFFQVNPDQAETLYKTALTFLDPQPESTLLDAFCGVGTLSIIAASQVSSVVGIEAVPQAVEDARANAKQNGSTNCQFICGTVEERIAAAPHFDLALLNPPRKGCDPAILKQLAKRAPKRIVYLSCDPATLARDLALLSRDGFQVTKVQPVDMFPQTMHVESVALINRI